MSKFKLLLISILAISIIYSCSKEEFNKLNTDAAAESKDIFSVNNSAAVKKCAIAFDEFLMHRDFKNNFLQDNGSPA